MMKLPPVSTSLPRQLVAAALACLAVCAFAQPASAVDGSELNASVGLWAPLFPDFQVDSTTDDSDEIGALVELSGHHRFDGYRTSAEGSIFYGDAGDISLFGYEALLRDTWSFQSGEWSAGFGFSQLTYDQDLLNANLESDFRGAKVVGGWETAFGRRPLWLDLGLGLYDMNGTFSRPGQADQEVSEFATTFSVEMKTDVCLWGIAARPSLKAEYISDLASFNNGVLATDEGVVLSAMLELRLANRR